MTSTVLVLADTADQTGLQTLLRCLQESGVRVQGMPAANARLSERVLFHLRLQPNAQHELGAVIQAVAGTYVPTRINGEGNPEYQRWIHAARIARRQLELESGKKFVTRMEGRERVYSLV